MAAPKVGWNREFLRSWMEGKSQAAPRRPTFVNPLNSTRVDDHRAENIGVDICGYSTDISWKDARRRYTRIQGQTAGFEYT
jgi:hypothetical protein